MGVVAGLHLNGRGNFGHHVNRLLLVFAEEGIQKSGVAYLMTHFVMLEKDVYALPQRVIQNLDHFLMYERILFAGCYRVEPMWTGQRKCHGLAFLSAFQGGRHFWIAFRRTKAHDHIVRLQEYIKPRPEKQRKIKRWERPLANYDGVYKLHRNVLRVG